LVIGLVTYWGKILFQEQILPKSNPCLKFPKSKKFLKVFNVRKNLIKRKPKAFGRKQIDVLNRSFRIKCAQIGNIYEQGFYLFIYLFNFIYTRVKHQDLK